MAKCKWRKRHVSYNKYMLTLQVKQNKHDILMSYSFKMLIYNDPEIDCMLNHE